jgi:hypothetical protein
MSSPQCGHAREAASGRGVSEADARIAEAHLRLLHHASLDVLAGDALQCGNALLRVVQVRSADAERPAAMRTTLRCGERIVPRNNGTPMHPKRPTIATSTAPSRRVRDSTDAAPPR